MTSWAAFADDTPDLAARVRAQFEAATHHVVATVRRDGSPRVSGTEVAFHDGQICLGSMWEARKSRDLRRDPRLALHSNPSDAEMTGGDAKLAGRAVEITDDDAKRAFVAAVFADRPAPPEDDPFHLFVIELDDVVLTEVDAEAGELIVSLWRPGVGVEVLRRR